MSLHVPCSYQGGRLHLSTPLRRAEGITKMPSSCVCMHMTRPHCLRAGWLLHHLNRFPTPTVISSPLQSHYRHIIERPLRVQSARHATSMQTALRLSNTSTSAKAHDTYADFRRNQHASPRRSIALAAASTPPAASEKEPEKSPSVTYVAVCNRVLFDVQPGRDQCLTLAVSLQLSILAVVVFGVANRVLYKMALVPMGNYVFFLAQLQTFGYVAVYFSILYARYKSGIVTQQMLDTPKKQFLLIGALEAAAQILGFIGAAKLPGVALPLLQQSMMLWQIGLGYFMLGKRLAMIQILGAAVVTVGVCTAAAPAQGGVGVLTEVSPMYAALFVGSMFFPALATIFKERIFSQAKQRLNGPSLDLFVVNSFGSAAQALFIFLLLPVMSSLRGIPITELPNYLSQGATCLMGGSPSCGSDCSGSPWLPLLYIAFNLGFNIAALNLLKTAGNVAMTLVMSSIVPATIFAFTLSLPYLPAAPPLGTNFWVGTAVLVAGLFTFNSPQWRPILQRKLQGKTA